MPYFRISEHYCETRFKTGLKRDNGRIKGRKGLFEGLAIFLLAGYFYGFIRQILNSGFGFIHRNLQIVFSNRDDIVGA